MTRTHLTAIVSALLLTCALSAQPTVAPPPAPTIRPTVQIALQGAFTTHDLTDSAIANNCIVIGGSMMSAVGNTRYPNPVPQEELDAFIGKSRADCVAMFKSSKTYKPRSATNPTGLDLANRTGLVIADVELPVAPQQWGRQSKAYRAAVRMRYEVCRECCPKALIGGYGLIYAPYVGDVNSVAGVPYPAGTTWLTGQWAGYQLCAAEGVFEPLDYLIAVAPAQWGTGDRPDRIASNVKAVAVAMEYTKRLNTGKSIALLVRWKVYNSVSVVNKSHVPADTLRTLIRTAVGAGADDVVIWAGVDGDIDPQILADVGRVSRLEGE